MQTIKATTLHLTADKSRYLFYDLVQIYSTFLSNQPDIDVTYIVDGKKIAEYSFRDSKFFKVIWQELNKIKAPAGLRSTSDIAVIPKHYLMDALKGYFVLPADDYGNSCYNLNQPLIYDIVKISDMKAIAYSHTKGITTGGMTLKLPSNIQARLATPDKIPFHVFCVPYEAIQKALQTLSAEYYIHIHLWYFPELRLQLADCYQQMYLKARKDKTSGNRKKYYRSRRLREKALSELCNILARQN